METIVDCRYVWAFDLREHMNPTDVHRCLGFRVRVQGLWIDFREQCVKGPATLKTTVDDINPALP